MKRVRFTIVAAAIAVALLSIGSLFFKKTNGKNTGLKAPPIVPYGDA